MFRFIFFVGIIQLVHAYKSMVLETPMPYPVSDMTATVFDGIAYDDDSTDDPRIYIVGGCISNQTYDANLGYYICTDVTDKVAYYKPRQNIWVDTVATAPTARFRHVAARLGTKLYIAGGRNVSDAIVNTIDVYDTIDDIWTTVSTIWSNPTSDGGAFTYNSLVYLIGGYDGIYDLESSLTAFDPSTSTFTTKDSMTHPRGDIAVTVNNNFAYVLGGWNASDNFCTAINYAERYDMVNDQWESIENMLYKRGDLVTGVIDNHVFDVAGETKSKDSNCSISIPVNTVGRYDIDKDEWFVEEELSLHLFRFVGVSFNSTELGIKAIYLFGGQGLYDPDNDNYPIKSSAIKYIPYSTVRNDNLSPLDIFGIVVGVVVAVAGFSCLGLSYLAYARRGYYTKKDISLSSAANTAFVNQDADEVIDLDLKASDESTVV